MHKFRTFFLIHGWSFFFGFPRTSSAIVSRTLMSNARVSTLLSMGNLAEDLGLKNFSDFRILHLLKVKGDRLVFRFSLKVVVTRSWLLPMSASGNVLVYCLVECNKRWITAKSGRRLRKMLVTYFLVTFVETYLRYLTELNKKSVIIFFWSSFLMLSDGTVECTCFPPNLIMDCLFADFPSDVYSNL